MSEHLRHDELIDALDDALVASRAAHLENCESCKAELARLRAVLHEVSGVGMPTPSPLFWDHFSARVRAATDGEPVRAAQAWWRTWWRPAGIMAAAAGALALVLVLRPSIEAPKPADVPTAKVAALPDDGSWGLVIGLASELDATDVREAAKPAAGTADAMLEELTTSQRAALVQLLKEDMGGLK
jgi:hypothetical protein